MSLIPAPVKERETPFHHLGCSSMRFYLDLPLVVGYVSMAVTACLGILQLAAARGGYSGLSLFTVEPRRGVRIGTGLTVGAVVLYALFAPEALTPGPAGTEVAGLFAFCALVALGITLAGADWRIRRARKRQTREGEPISLGGASATLYRPAPPLPGSPGAERSGVPAIVLMPDPTGFVCAPLALIDSICQAGIAVLELDARYLADSDAPFARRTLLGYTSTALVNLDRLSGIDDRRIGLLGLGLGGDAVLCAATIDPGVKAAAAVSPVASDTLTARGSGLDWLRELTIRQAWRWRRLSPRLKRAVADLGIAESTVATAPDSVNVHKNGNAILTMRNPERFFEALPVPSDQCFTLLDDKHARHRLVVWFLDEL